MAQHIWIKIIDNEGKDTILDINFANIYNLLTSDLDFVYLNKISPYSDTLFEGMEVKYLICDLKQVTNLPQVDKLIFLLSEVKQVTFIWD